MKPENTMGERNPTPTFPVGEAAAGLGVTPADVEKDYEKQLIHIFVRAEKLWELFEGSDLDYEGALDFVIKEVICPLVEGLGYEAKWEKFCRVSTSVESWMSPDFEEFWIKHSYAKDEAIEYAKAKKADMLVSFGDLEDVVCTLVWLKPKKEK